MINFRKLVSTTAAVLGTVAVTAFFAACSSSTSTTPPTSADKATITTSTGMQQGAVTSIISGKSPSISGNNGTTADSVVITKARIVISTLKLHLSGDADDDTLEHVHDGDKDVIKAGPFIAEFDLGSEKIISTVTIPPGTYDHIKFEIHKLNENEDQSLLNDPLFGDFVNGGRYTFIIDGISYVNGVGYPFSFKSSQTDNVTFFFEPPVLFDANHAYDLTLKFDPKLMFGRPGMRPLDPRDTDNRHDIEKLLKSAIKALRSPR